jgi:hypothetical protein
MKIASALLGLLTLTVLLCSAQAEDAPAKPKDPFEEGSLWAGEAKRKNLDGVAKVGLTVLKRKQDRFQGELIVKTPNNEVMTIQVVGIATTKESGIVAFNTEKKGLTQVALRGKLEKGELTMYFIGTQKFGEGVFGAVVLKPKN